MVEFKAEVASTLTLVDHSLFRLHQGAVGMILVQGPNNPNIISSIKNATTTPQTDQHVMPPTMTMSTTTLGPSGLAASSSGQAQVVIANFAYLPAQLTVPAGTTVTWVNKDAVGHAVTEGKPESPKPASQRVFDSSHGGEGASAVVIQPGQSWSFTFTIPGEYDYYCLPHTYMRGHITVTPSGTSGSQSYGYGSLTNFYVILTGKELIALSALGLILLVGMMIVFSKTNRKPEENTN